MSKYYAITSSLADGSTEASLFIPPECACRIIPALIWVVKQCKVKSMLFDRNDSSNLITAFVVFETKEEAQEICQIVDKSIIEKKSLSYLYLMLKSSEIKRIKKDIAPILEYIEQFDGNFAYGVFALSVESDQNSDSISNISESAINTFNDLVSPYF